LLFMVREYLSTWIIPVFVFPVGSVLGIGEMMNPDLFYE